MDQVKLAAAVREQAVELFAVLTGQAQQLPTLSATLTGNANGGAQRLWASWRESLERIHAALAVKTPQALYYKAGGSRLLTIVLTRDLECFSRAGERRAVRWTLGDGIFCLISSSIGLHEIASFSVPEKRRLAVHWLTFS